jgi:acyl-CoA thioesterase-1
MHKLKSKRAFTAATRVSALTVMLHAMSYGLAKGEPVRIVAVGASNTWGWGVIDQNAFPARLQALLRAKGIEAYVNSAGVIGDTTAGMLRRIDYAAPDGTKLVILQPGGNDLRFFGTGEQREANIAAIERRLRERGIKVIVFDPIFSPGYFSFDGIHFTSAAHAQIAADLAPLVTAALEQPLSRARRTGRAGAARKPQGGPGD